MTYQESIRRKYNDIFGDMEDKPMTKRERAYITRYEESTDICLSDVYKSFSTAKYIAWQECVRKYRKEDGQGFRIISHNCCFFSVAWMTPDYTKLHVITPGNNFYIDYRPF